jgi:hypothetical protein
MAEIQVEAIVMEEDTQKMVFSGNNMWPINCCN